MTKFIVRDHESSDIPFLYESWLQGLRYSSSEWLAQMPNDIFYAQFRKYLKTLMDRPNVKIKIACLEEDPDVILGYAVYEPTGDFTCMHWIFVKSSFRLHGIGRMLMPDNVKTCSHLSKIGNSLSKKYNIKFNPFIGE